MQVCVLVETTVDEDTAFDELADTDELEMSTYMNDELDCVAVEDAAALDELTVADKLDCVALGDAGLPPLEQEFRKTAKTKAFRTKAKPCALIL